MSKSFDFCIERAQNPERSTIADRDYSEAFEVPLYTVVEYFKDKKVFNWKDENLSVTITYDPDADFQYFACGCSIHDGTLIFELDCMEILFNELMRVQTWIKDAGYPESFNGAELYYTVGNFVVCNEYSKRFATKEKPWTTERTTVMLPIAYYSFKEES